MAVVILLGAGASFGSECIDVSTPPLGNGLFTELVKKGGVASSLPNEIKKVFENNFEEGMAEYYKYSNGDVMSFQRELAQYLASFTPTDLNVYIKLIKELDSKRIIYSSLNYDLLFELSAEKVGLTRHYSSEYKEGKVRLLKIHGSSNFWPDFPTGTFQNCIFANNGKADMEVQIRPLNQDETKRKCLLEDSVAPSIAMFAVGKTVKISPNYVDKQYAMWKKEVLKSSKIFIIGVRVHEIDKHIWGVLGKTKAKVTYFGFDNDKVEFEQWKSNYDKKNAYFIKSDFKKSVQVIKKSIAYKYSF